MALGWPRRRRYGDKGGSSSHGLIPIRSKPADKRRLSTLSFYPSTAYLLKLRKKYKHTQLWLCAQK